MESFPTLKEATAANGNFSKQNKKKKKKGISFTLSEFTTGTYVGPGGARREPKCDSKGLTAGEMLLLPSGPRERSPDELSHSRLCNGFRPHRADEVDKWFSEKKTFDGFSRNGERERPRIVLNPPKRDSSRPNPFAAARPREEVLAEKGLDWRKMESESEIKKVKSYSSRSTSLQSSRPVSSDSKVSEEGGVVKQRHKVNPFGDAKPREVVLQEKGIDWRKIDGELEHRGIDRPETDEEKKLKEEIEMKKGKFYSSISSSLQSSRPESSDSKASEGGVAKQRHKVNPFGDEKPREVVLQEKGMDWKKIDQELEHRGIGRPETDEEKKLNEEIDHLKKELCSQTEANMNSDSLHHFTEQCDSLVGKIKEREKELENLMHELDDKVRFTQRASADSRHGFGSGRAAFFADKPSVQNGVSEGLRQREFGCRGTSDSWNKPVNGKWGFVSSKDSGFFANRSMNRLKSGERW